MMTPAEFRRLKNIHIWGIGGIGASALARLLRHEGKKVTGQDSSTSSITDELERSGIPVFIGQSIDKIPKGTELIVYSLAIPERDKVFMQKLKDLGIPLLSYPQALGAATKGKHIIAVAGTHGKTTTTAMIAEVLIHAGLDPTVVVGSVLKKYKSNFVPGKGRHVVMEADEYQRSFLNFSPRILVITNIGEDHLDYYKDIADIRLAFNELVSRVPRGGYVITSLKDVGAHGVLAHQKGRVIDYADFFDNEIKLPVAGKHNRQNAAAAFAVAHVLGIPKEKAREALQEFSGTWRRFDYLGKTAKGALVYDDYAHNPDKVRAAIAGFREAHPKNHLIIVFQPHLYSRTKTLLPGFAEAFDGADEVVVMPIFAAREESDTSVSSEILVERIKKHLSEKEFKKPKISFASDFNKLAVSLKRRFGRGDTLVTMGAGDIYQLADRLVSRKK